MRQTISSIISNAILYSAILILAVACGDRPDSDICVVNAKAKHEKCYNLKRDYDDEGNLTPDAKPSFHPAAAVEDLDKHTCMDPDSFERFKAWLNKNKKQNQGAANE